MPRPRAFTDPALLSRPGAVAVVAGALAFAAALTPSLIPRTGAMQGLVAGLCFALAYGLGAALTALARWVGLRFALPRGLRLAAWVTAGAIALGALTQATGWQDAVHRAMGAPPVETARPFIILTVSLLTAILAILSGRLFRRAVIVAANPVARLVPPRLAVTLALIATSSLAWAIGNGVVIDRVLRGMDELYRSVDAALPGSEAAPASPLDSGGPASLIGWETLGVEGRRHVLGRPAAAEIARLAGGIARDPIRVYVGLNSAPDPKARARLALDELIRTGAFDRKLLVITTPTGRGWIDPASLTPLEILHRGDVASVAVQYSYLPSWLSLLVEPDYGRATATATFAAIYDHWRSLPRDRRPRLYLHGLSLGAMNSDLAADVYDILADPHDGAFWVGTPFSSTSWQRFTFGRTPDSPEWLPRFRDGSLVRFANQQGGAPGPAAPWGPMRIVYLQYASDPIVFFQPSMFWREPDWMRSPRGPDVAPEMRWVPLVSGLQVMVDMMTATNAGKGTGHVYAARHYLDGWVQLTAPEGWTPAGTAALRDWFTRAGL